MHRGNNTKYVISSTLSPDLFAYWLDKAVIAFFPYVTHDMGSLTPLLHSLPQQIHGCTFLAKLISFSLEAASLTTPS